MRGLETWKLDDCLVILSQSKSKTHKTMDNDIPTNNTNIHISNYTQNIQNWNKESKCKQRIDESKEDKHKDIICSLEFYWVVNHRFLFFILDFYTLYYKCLICSIMSKESSRI